MRKAIAALARKNNRSINSQIIALVEVGLELALEKEGKPSRARVSDQLLFELEDFLGRWRSKVAAERLVKPLDK
jgi:hypothetical protein